MVRREERPHEDVFPAGRGLTLVERGEIERALRDLDYQERERCTPAGSRAVEWAAEMLTSNFKARRRFSNEEDQRADEDRIAAGFLIALDGRPAAAVTEAVRLILAGETDLSRTYQPTATELAGVVRAVTERWSVQRGRLQQLLLCREEPPPEPERPMTDAEREELRQRVARLTGRGR